MRKVAGTRDFLRQFSYTLQAASDSMNGQTLELVTAASQPVSAALTRAAIFLGYSRSPRTIEQMLQNMFVDRPPGNYDHILDFSTAVKGHCSMYRLPLSSTTSRLRLPQNDTP